MRSCEIDIPHFGTTLLMVTQCSHCSLKDVDVRPGGGYSEKGRRVTLHVKSINDLGRDLINSDSTSITLPSLGIEKLLISGGRYTTVEGVLRDIEREMKGSKALVVGDSDTKRERERKENIFKKFKKVCVCFSLSLSLFLSLLLLSSFISISLSLVSFSC